MPNKFHARRVQIDGIWFDSIGEGQYYSMLKLREKAGEIRNLEVHKKFRLVVDGSLIATMIIDYVWFEGNGRKVVDFKGGTATITPVFRLKKKLFEALNPGCEIIVVTKQHPDGVPTKTRRTRSKPLPDKLTVREYREL